MTTPTRGRPQASSRNVLADAACELFLEQGYEATTVADITRRAGVSRSSFFNYFDGKAATLWFSLDERLDRFSCAAEGGQDAIGEALSALAADLGAAPPHTLALAITNAEIMGISEQLGTERAVRQAALAAQIARARTVAGGSGTADSGLRAEIYGAASAAAVFGAIWQWAERGAGTTNLESTIRSALSAVEHGPVRVAVIGAGAIGSAVVRELETGQVDGAVLSGVLTRSRGSFEELLATSDLFVECAGVAAARTYGPRVVAAGRALMLVSIGALADPEIRSQLSSGPGVLHLSSGAIGGLDLLAAAARRAQGADGRPGIDRAEITSTKQSASLVQGWMSDAEAARLRSADEPFELFSGTVAEAITKFPGSLNVACALAAATGLWDDVRVRLVADPNAPRTTHEIKASGFSGSYCFSIENEVSPENPTTSGVVAQAVLRAIEALTGKSLRFT